MPLIVYNIPETAVAVYNPDPYNSQVPEIGIPAHTALETPLGVVPHYKTPSQYWSWDYGNS